MCEHWKERLYYYSLIHIYITNRKVLTEMHKYKYYQIIMTTTMNLFITYVFLLNALRAEAINNFHECQLFLDSFYVYVLMFSCCRSFRSHVQTLNTQLQWACWSSGTFWDWQYYACKWWCQWVVAPSMSSDRIQQVLSTDDDRPCFDCWEAQCGHCHIASI